MRCLGAVIAGGQSSRFGGDKGSAVLNGRALIDHVIEELDMQCDDETVVCGRTWENRVSLSDLPGPGLGPLGGLCAALHYAAANGFDRVLTAGCDTFPIPTIPVSRDHAAVIDGHYLFGSWPVSLAPLLDAHLANGADRSMRGWLVAAHGYAVPVKTRFYNLNTQADFDHYAATQGLSA